ncbi:MULTISPECIES: DUF6998 domain-containing protein [Enterobacterales]|uniref:DUF6998 domain-containing protein n=1 Tax=Enterobacterales TaxID=91347 RepID=UPI00084E2A77|nr:MULTISPECIES: hypothetical protein [Enterobacteriaceae]HED1420700.1 hypothetical protein [Kluyvera georgiana]HEE9987935.1 hypothetical protein [Citrobacter freundii]MCK2094273.1 hypothetical protein [Enterobacter hormaechei]OEG80832.1 hypothetical protein AN661_0223875 [Enterobacter hormaechei subsp. hoffmannii]QCK77218.1 hypothetical protein E4K08_11605 [Raoultella ornithinolytica]
MSLSQFQIIQSLGKSLEWLQQELSWGVSAQELSHLTGRIGELYTAMYTYGQMALENNQHGYDVISSEGERISVKTITTSNHVSFTKSTLSYVDRIVILEINTTDLEINILVDSKKEELLPLLRDTNGKKLLYPLGNKIRDKNAIKSSKTREIKPLSEMEIREEVYYKNHIIRQYENGTIEVLTDGISEKITKPTLIKIAKELSVSPINSAGSKMNTRQLGDKVIKNIKAII